MSPTKVTGSATGIRLGESGRSHKKTGRFFNLPVNYSEKVFN